MSIPSAPKVGGLATRVDGRSTAPDEPARPTPLGMQAAPGSAGSRNPARHKASSHNKLTRPNDLYALIAVHTDAAGRIDCSGITKLALSRSTFTDEDLALLKNFPDLRELDLSDCTRITGKGIGFVICWSSINWRRSCSPKWVACFKAPG